LTPVAAAALRESALAPVAARDWDPAAQLAYENIQLIEELPASATARMPSQDQAFERIGAAVRLNLEQLKGSIEQARNESSQFFKLTLIFAGLGFLVVVSGVVLLLAHQVAGATVTSISGIIPELTAVLFFRKDKELRIAVGKYNQHLLDSQHILTMIDVAETIQNVQERDSLKRQIIVNALSIGGAANDTSNATVKK
jgi:hypothetical protein